VIGRVRGRYPEQNQVDNPVWEPDRADIAQRAMELWQTRGRPDGSPENDWFDAQHTRKQGDATGSVQA
jgi:hypothetical protein